MSRMQARLSISWKSRHIIILSKYLLKSTLLWAFVKNVCPFYHISVHTSTITASRMWPARDEFSGALVEKEKIDHINKTFQKN